MQWAGLANRGFVASAGKLAVLAQQAGHLAIDARVGGHAFALFQEVGFTGEVAHQPTRFGDQQGARGHVPGAQAGFEEAVGKSGGHISQVERGSTRAAHAGHLGHHVLQHLHEGLEVVSWPKRKAGADQAVFELGAFGHADAAVIQVSAAATGGAEQVVAGGVVYHGLLRAAIDHEGNADAVNGKAVDEVGGAVQRVDDPDMAATLVAFALPATGFFGPDAVIRVSGQQRFDDGLLGRMIDLGDEVVGLLGRDANGLDVERGTVDDRTGGARGLDGHVEHGVQMGGHELCEEQQGAVR